MTLHSKRKYKLYQTTNKQTIKSKYKNRNINKTPLKKCSIKPITGFYRNGYCNTGYRDLGRHTICATMNPSFMEYTKKQGNNLYSVVRPGKKWCLCENRWNQAYLDGFAPKVIADATHIKTNQKIISNIRKSLSISS